MIEEQYSRQDEYYNKQYDEISLKELILILLRNKVLILITAGLIFITTVFVSYYMNSNSKEAKLLFSVNFSGIEKGKNIDGSEFDVYEFVSPYILKEVIKVLNLEGKISSNDIRKNVIIEPLIPKSIEEKKKFLLEKEGEDFIYYPNQFLLRLKVDKSSGIDSELAMKISNQIIESYIDYFSKNYMDMKPVINKIITFNIDDYDYSDVSMVFHSQLDEIVVYNKKLSEIASEYRSKNTGLSFNDIVQTVKVIDEVYLNRIDSIISSFKLTKDKSKLKIYYEYVLDKLKLEKNKLESSKNISATMLSEVENSSESFFLDVNDEKQRESYFSNLVLKTSEFGNSLSDIQKDIDYYTSELNDLENDVVLGLDKRKQIYTAEKLIDSTYSELQNWINITNKTSEEFYDKLMTSVVTQLSPSEIYSSVNIKLNLAIGLVLGLMLGVFIAFFKSYWTES